jgi:phosphoribosylformimino-5-aminoimidazole carboxamide ribotide isomerase
VVLGTAAIEHPEFAREACARHAVVIAVDARDGRVATAGWTRGSSRTAREVASWARDLGARAVLYTDIARDGTGRGPDRARTVVLAQALRGCVVCASGGVGTLEDVRALARAGVPACVVGRALYDGRFSLPQALEAAREAPA